ncbi:hypothetical protein [Hazenella coriacea]|uniref:hypothetical protein n=1 Tax=Hazenella coriacea TaxID=1179467 RepID=UPI003C746EE2
MYLSIKINRNETQNNQKRRDLLLKNKYQQTPLHKTMMHDQLKTVQYLLKNGASVRIIYDFE